jgi:hypothetical protein
MVPGAGPPHPVGGVGGGWLTGGMLRQPLRCPAVADDDGCQTRSYAARAGGMIAPMSQNNGKKIPTTNMTQ